MMRRRRRTRRRRRRRMMMMMEIILTYHIHTVTILLSFLVELEFGIYYRCFSILGNLD